MLPIEREPTSPGEILREEFLKPLKITQAQLANKMGVGVQTVNMLINGRRAVTAETAIRLARVLDTSPHFWMNAQVSYDLWHAHQKLAS